MPPPRHVYETYIRTTPEQLWRALTDPSFTQRYFFRSAFEGSVAAGQPYAFRDGEGMVTVDGTIEEADPFRRLVMTVHFASDPEAADEQPSRVTWEITPLGDVCRLTLVHGDLFGAPRSYGIAASTWSPTIASLKTLLETDAALPDVAGAGTAPPSEEVVKAWHRAEGIEANNLTYDLLERADRTPADDARIVHTAHAAAYHWDLAGTDVQRARAEYLCSRVYAVMGRGEPALFHARRCLGLVQANGLDDFDLVYANEAMARALAAQGELSEASEYLAAAHATPVADAEDRAIVEADLAAGPWYGLTS